MRSLMVMATLSGCTMANPAYVQAIDDGTAPDLGTVRPADLAGPPAADLARVAADFGPLAQVDLSPAPDLTPAPTPDLARPADLEPAPDLTPPPACGGQGQPCCAGGACGVAWPGGPSMICLYAGDTCAGVRATTCTVPLNCGGPGLRCCDALGNPTSTGYCESGAACSSGACRSCT